MPRDHGHELICTRDIADASQRLGSFKDLIVWRRSRELCVAVYRVAAHLPASERFEMRSQLCRAAVSIPTNIAEGHARFHRLEYLHHLSYALGSLAECETLVLCHAPGEPYAEHPGQQVVRLYA